MVMLAKFAGYGIGVTEDLTGPRLGCLGATCGATVSMSAFLACHQCYCAGSSLAWGLNLWAIVCGIF